MKLSSYMQGYLKSVRPRHYKQYNVEIEIITAIKEVYKLSLRYIKKHYKNRYEVIKNKGKYIIRTFKRGI